MRKVELNSPHTAPITGAGEAAHVIDGLLYHEADLSISTHHTDGGGVSDHVFALAHVLGIRFAPRIPNLTERRLYAFGTPALGRRWRPSSQAGPTRRPSRHNGTTCCALRPRSAPA